MSYPRPVESVHQIEITSRCQLKCVYCPSAKLDKPLHDNTTGELLPLAAGGGYGRAKEDMTMEAFERALEHARWCDDRGTQGELALTGLGEALIHPLFLDMLAAARGALPHNLLTCSTNGIVLAQLADKDPAGLDRTLDAIADHDLRMYVSLHRPEKAAIAANLLRDRGLLAATNAAFADGAAMDWAGGLEWQVTIPEDAVTCEFLRSGWCVVLADGRVTTCCLDAEGGGVIGHVDDDPGTLHVKPWKGARQGCDTCHMRVP